MNAILQKVLKAAEKLSPEDQKILADEIEKRTHELWLESEVQKGVASYAKHGGTPARDVFDRLKRDIGG